MIFNNYNFFVICSGGDGPKRTLLEDVCEQCKLQDRVEFLGKLEHEKVRDVSVPYGNHVENLHCHNID